MSTYELLAPAGDFAMLSAALNAGADAIYFGLADGFTMRANAKNFCLGDLQKMREQCDAHKAKMYLTMNTIIYSYELHKLDETVKKVKPYVDAIICWDLSVIQACKKHNVPFHISTQASIANKEAAQFYVNLGAERVVLAREVGVKYFKDIAEIAEIEVFVHGALCVAVSGRCLMSQHLFNKSANRGQCIQPCRRPYTIKDSEGNELRVDNHHVLSAKDLCTLPFIEKLKGAGVTSFKIEGRTRDPRYVDVVVRAYREALDTTITKERTKELLDSLAAVYNKEFSSGFYLGSPTPDDFARKEHSAATKQKTFIGKVTHYYPKPGVASIKLVHALEKGAELSIIGKTTGHLSLTAESLEVENKQVNTAQKDQEVALKVREKVRKNDEVYIITSRNLSEEKPRHPLAAKKKE